MTARTGSTDSSVAVRRRCAIVFADLAESVRLMHVHEADAIARWRRFVDDARGRLLPARGGRLVRTAGDGLLIECENAIAAAEVSFALHAALLPLNDGRADDARLALRIGIHVAEVLFDEYEAYGAGVNLAQRLSGLALPGGTVASAIARDELADGLHADVEDLGQRYVKNLDEPVRAFALRPPGAAARRPEIRLPPLQDLRPAVAVVPFVALPADPAHDALGHAVADDIIAALARHPGLRVLSRATTAAVRGSALTPQQLQPLLGAAYLLTGHYYLFGERVRTQVELCETHSGQVLWTGQATASVASLFEGMDDLVPHIVANISERVMAHELERVRSLPMDTLESYTLYLGAVALMNGLSPHGFRRARELIGHLIERHPRHAAPQAAMARWHVFNVVQAWSADPDQDIAHAEALAARAVEVDPQQPLALSSQGLARMTLHQDLEGARERLEAALAIDPQDAQTWAMLSGVMAYAGQPRRAQELSAQALDRSPLDPYRFLLQAYAAMADIAAGEYESAVGRARDSVRHHLLHAPSHLLLVGALALAGHDAEARAAAQRALQVCPATRVGNRGRRPHRPAPDWRDALAEAARGAGLP